MLNTKQIEIAARLYENQSYGTTHGKGLYRKALYNGSIDTKAPNVKYVIDLFVHADWSNQAKSDDQMIVIDTFTADVDKLYSWIHRYDTFSKSKTLVGGVCTLDLNTMEMVVLICDEKMGVEDTWHISAKKCQVNKNGLRSPQLLATNADLAVWS